MRWSATSRGAPPYLGVRPGTSQETRAVAAKPSIMYCVSCNSSTRVSGARYCARCGAPLQSHLWSEGPSGRQEPEPAVDGPAIPCLRCGRENPSRHAHCVYCGSRLDADGGAAPVKPADGERAAEAVSAAQKVLAAGKISEARAQAEKAVSLDPGSAEAHALLSEILHQQGSLGGALHEMTAALRCDPHNAGLERRLRDLRDEQDRALAPLLRGLDEPSAPRRPARRAPVWPSLPRASDVRLPDWARAAILIGAAMLLMGLLPRLMSGVGSVIGLVIAALITLFVYRDARSLGMSMPVTLLWAGLIFFTTFFTGWYGLLAFLAYLVSTRMRR